jgi:hypothetical protein
VADLFRGVLAAFVPSVVRLYAPEGLKGPLGMFAPAFNLSATGLYTVGGGVEGSAGHICTRLQPLRWPIIRLVACVSRRCERLPWGGLSIVHAIRGEVVRALGCVAFLRAVLVFQGVQFQI